MNIIEADREPLKNIKCGTNIKSTEYKVKEFKNGYTCLHVTRYSKSAIYNIHVAKQTKKLSDSVHAEKQKKN